METILVLHGFGSSGEHSTTCGKIKKYFTKIGYNVITPTYNMDNLPDFINSIEPPNIIIGISLGGFIARYLVNEKFPNTELIMLNPSIYAYENLKNRLGENEYYKTGEKFNLTQENLNYLKTLMVEKDKTDIWITSIVCKDDEIVNPYDAIKIFENRNLYILDYGGHRMNNDTYLKIIEETLNRFIF